VPSGANLEDWKQIHRRTFSRILANISRRVADSVPGYSPLFIFQSFYAPILHILKKSGESDANERKQFSLFYSVSAEFSNIRKPLKNNLLRLEIHCSIP